MPRRQPQLKQPHIPCAYRPRNSMGKRPAGTDVQEEPVMKKPAAWHCIDEQDEVVNNDDEQQEQQKEQKKHILHRMSTTRATLRTASRTAERRAGASGTRSSRTNTCSIRSWSSGPSCS